MSSLTQTVTDFTFAFETIGIDGFTQKGKTKISQNGIDIFQGAITIYKGLTTGTEKLLYTDSDEFSIIGTVNATAVLLADLQLIVGIYIHLG